MDAGKIRDRIAEGLGRLEKRQKTLILLLIASILFSFYYNGVYKPRSNALRARKRELATVNNRVLDLKGRMPDLRAAQSALKTAGARLDAARARLRSLESQLPTQGSVPQLLGELVSQAAGYSIDFVSVRPKTDKGRGDYAELAIDIKFNSGYSDFANYLNRLESTSRFLRAENILMEEMKDGFRGKATTTLTLATFLGEGWMAGESPGSPEPAPRITIDRNPFISRFRPSMGRAEKEGLELSGIVAGGKRPTAIIDDEVYGIGDRIENKEVKNIISNMVILTDGRKETVLTLDDAPSPREDE